MIVAAVCGQTSVWLKEMRRLWIARLILMALPVAGTAARDSPLYLAGLRLTPAAIDTSTSPADLEVHFTIGGCSPGPFYFEVGLADPLGIVAQRASASFTAAHSVAGSVRVTLPAHSSSGTWTVASAFAADGAGNSVTLDTQRITAAGFPTTFRVVSVVDNTPPKLDAISFAPLMIDTTLGPADVTVKLKATDDLSGVRLFEMSFRSPSGTDARTVRFDLSPGTAVAASKALTFPRFSESGTWTAGAVFLADAAGNTLVLDGEALAARGFTDTLTVLSVQDTIAPRLVAFDFSPIAIETNGSAVSVLLKFQIGDDLSGATTFQASFTSPSGHIILNGSARFMPTLSQTGAAAVVFPAGSEIGIWTVTSVFLADQAGNTATLTTSDLAEYGFPHQLTVANRPAQALRER